MKTGSKTEVTQEGWMILETLSDFCIYTKNMRRIESLVRSF